MWLRANITLAIAVIFAVIQMFASVTGGPRASESSALASPSNSGFTRSVAAQDDNDDDDDDDNDDDDDDNDDDDDDNDDDDDDNDDDDDDNDDDDDDNDDDDDDDNDDEDNDEDDDDSDNDDDDDNDDSDNDDSDNDDEDDDTDDELDDELDNIEADIAADPAATVDPVASIPGAPTTTGVQGTTGLPPVTEAQLVTTGMDATLALQTDRVVVQVFSTMPAGINLKVQMVDPLLYQATPGIRAGNLIFVVEATDAFGTVLPTLPGEVNLAVRYTDIDVTGLDDTAITLARLDPLDNMWKTAPKLVTDPLTNYLAASVMDTGVYAVYVP